MPAEGFKIADAYVQIVADLDRNQVRRAVDSAVTEAAPQIEKDTKSTLGKAFAGGLTEGFKQWFSFKSIFSGSSTEENVRRDTRSTIGRAIVNGIGDALGNGLALGKGLFNGLSGLATAIIGNPVVIAVGVAIAGVLGLAVAGALSAAITAGLGLGLGGLLLGVGALLLKDNKKLVKQFEKSWSSIKKIMIDAAEPLVGPFIGGLKDVAWIVKELGPDFKALFRSAAPLVPMLTKGLQGFLKPLLDGLKDAMPGINAAFAGLTKNMPILGASIGNFFRTIFKDGPLVEKITGALVRFFAWMFDVAGPGIQRFTVLFGAFINFMRLFSIGWDGIWANLIARFDGGSGAVQRLKDAFGPLYDQVKRVWGVFQEFARAEDDKIIGQKFLELVTEIKKLWGPLKDFIGVVWDEAWAFVGRIWENRVKPWWENTAEPWLKEKVKAGVKAAFNAAVQAGMEELGKLPGKVTTLLGTIPGLAQQAIVSGFSGAGGWLVSAGQSIISGLIQGLKNQVGALKTYLGTVTNMIPNWKGPMAVDRKLLVPTGKAIMGGLQTGMESEVAGLKSMLGRFTASLAAPSPAPSAGGGRPSVTFNLAGAVFADEEAMQRFIARLYQLLGDYERQYA